MSKQTKYIKSNKQIPSFFGLQPYNVEISQNFGSINYFGLDNPFAIRSYIGNKQDISICAEFSLDGYGYDSLRRFVGNMSGCPLHITNLGDTEVCSYCKREIMPGFYTCHRCGGYITEIVENSKYVESGILAIDSITTENIMIHRKQDESIRVRLEMSLFTDDYITQDFFAGWHTTHIEPGWICWYCNSINNDYNIDCEFCGSGKLPFSDLKKIHSNCVYCNTPLKGNICTNCLASARGYSVWPPRYDW